jgi:hypothetical protein
MENLLSEDNQFPIPEHNGKTIARTVITLNCIKHIDSENEHWRRIAFAFLGDAIANPRQIRTAALFQLPRILFGAFVEMQHETPMRAAPTKHAH